MSLLLGLQAFGLLDDYYLALMGVSRFLYLFYATYLGKNDFGLYYKILKLPCLGESGYLFSGLTRIW